MDTARTMRLLFRAPRPGMMIVPILVLSVVLGLMLESVGERAVYAGLLVFAVPAFLSAALSVPLANALGGRLYLRRSALLSTIALVPFLFFLPGWVLRDVVGWPVLDTPVMFLLFGYAASIWLRQMVLMATSNANLLRSLPAVMTQPILGFAALVPVYPTTMTDLYAAVALSATFLVATSGFMAMANSPLKRTFGMSGLRLIRLFLDHITEGEEAGREELEGFFQSFSVRVNALVGAAAFRTEDRVKALLVVPLVHPGPFGYLGGSDLPAKVARELQDVSEHVIVAHGPSTHDYNPATSGECARLAAHVRQMLAAPTATSEASPLVRARARQAKATAQVLGDWALLTSTFSPLPSDDLDFATGHALVEMARKSGMRDAIPVDAHNCLELGSGRVNFGSQESQDVLAAAQAALTQAREQVSEGLRIGFAERRGYDLHEDGLGAMGIQALVLEAGGSRAAYVVYDGNNMVPGLREEILSALGSLVDAAEVLTTDNHSVNIRMGGYNPVGAKIGRPRLIADTRAVAQAALGDLEPVTVTAATGEVSDLLIFGHENASRLSSVINATMSTLRFGAALSIALGVALSLVMLLLLY